MRTADVLGGSVSEGRGEAALRRRRCWLALHWRRAAQHLSCLAFSSARMRLVQHSARCSTTSQLRREGSVMTLLNVSLVIAACKGYCRGPVDLQYSPKEGETSRSTGQCMRRRSTPTRAWRLPVGT